MVSIEEQIAKAVDELDEPTCSAIERHLGGLSSVHAALMRLIGVGVYRVDSGGVLRPVPRERRFG